MRGGEGGGSPNHVRRVDVLDVAHLPSLCEVSLDLLLHERTNRRVCLVPAAQGERRHDGGCEGESGLETEQLEATILQVRRTQHTPEGETGAELHSIMCLRHPRHSSRDRKETSNPRANEPY